MEQNLLKEPQAALQSESSHHVQSSGVVPQTMLVNELRSIISYLLSGVATVTSHFVPKSNRNVWVVKGPEKNPIIVLHFQNNPLLVGEEGLSDLVIIPDSDYDNDCETCPARTTSGPVSCGGVSNNCELEERTLPSTSKEKSELSSQAALASTSHQQTPNIKNLAGGDCPTIVELLNKTGHHKSQSSSTPILQNLLVQTEQELAPSFFKAADKHIVSDFAIPEVRLVPCRQISLERNEQSFDDKEGQTLREVARKSPDIDDTYTIKSEAIDDTNSHTDYILGENNVDCQLTSSWTPEVEADSDQYKPTDGDSGLCLDKNVIADELGQLSDEINAGVPSDNRLETVSANNKLWKHNDKTSHEKTHSSEKPYQCSYCDERFTHFVFKKSHERIHRPTEEKSFQCSCCDKKFTKAGHLKSHERTHTGEKPFQCAFCDKKFSERASKKTHERIHTGEKPYQCSYCDMTFSQTGHQKLHERKHTGEKPFQCSFCDKTFSQVSNQKMHERRHTGEKPHECSYCNKRFSDLTTLKSHERIHTNEKPYQCSYCGKQFTELALQKSHERTHTGEKPYPCSYCDKMFSLRENKKVHERTHTGEKPFQCSYCDKKFSERTAKKCHERTHTGEKPYQCSFCDKKFTERNTKKTHERTHTGEKPFQCSYCDKTFSRSRSKKLHEETHCS